VFFKLPLSVTDRPQQPFHVQEAELLKWLTNSSPRPV
jgi:hypothetical protein